MENFENNERPVFDDVTATAAIFYYAGMIFVAVSAGLFLLWIMERAQ